ncbi:unnamed protein product [Aspergillus oryzae var. brunneus]|uniref:Unnamed protein product n=1 Tax=Aspergillus oryzae var. brunneus TaxID=332754 RepID=A0ABQ6LAS6_ASPOZ|nr:unnamed protein product [Aspergillus oryzae var. brunneus]
MAEEAVANKVKCTYIGCKLVFKSEKEMKHHKKFDSEHAYCDECEEDFEDEERLLIHKIKSVKHIVCPVCGIDFGSDGGRNSHIRQVRPSTYPVADSTNIITAEEPPLPADYSLPRLQNYIQIRQRSDEPYREG